MMILTCGCCVPFNEDDPDERYCAVWYRYRYEDYYCDGEYETYYEQNYGTLCDKHLVIYEATRCKLGGGSL